jgi:hypothetical protein
MRNHKRGRRMAEKHGEMEATEINNKKFQACLQLPRRESGS